MSSGFPSPTPRREPAPSRPRPFPVAPPPEKPTRRWWLAAILLATATVGALYLRNVLLQPITGGGPPILTVPTATVVLGPLERTLRLTGSTAAEDYAVLRAPRIRGGRGSSLTEVRDISTNARRSKGGGGGGGGGGVQIMRGTSGGRNGSQMTLVSLSGSGTVVRKGDVVAEFDREDMLLRLDDFRSRVAQNDANRANVKAEIEVLEKDHSLSIREALADVGRARLDLKTSPVRSAIDQQNFRLALEEAEAIYKLSQTEVPLMQASLQAQWRIAELARDEGYAELKRTEANVDRMLLRAPIDGLVVMMTTMRRGSAEQAQIKAGDQVGSGQPVAQIVDLSSMVVNAAVNQTDVERVRVGAEARVRFDAYPDLELPAEVFGIGAMPRASRFQADYVGEVPVALRLLELDPRVLPDLSVSADVVLSVVPEGIIAPLEAVFTDGPGDTPYVFVREPQGWARREVELGDSNYLSVVIRSGLQAGDEVATARPPANEVAED